MLHMIHHTLVTAVDTNTYSEGERKRRKRRKATYDTPYITVVILILTQRERERGGNAERLHMIHHTLVTAVDTNTYSEGEGKRRKRSKIAMQNVFISTRRRILYVHTQWDTELCVISNGCVFHDEI